MRRLGLILILSIYFAAVEANGREDAFPMDAQVEVEGILATVSITNPLNSPISCSGTIYGDTYFDDRPYLPLRSIILTPGETRTFYVRSRYGDPLEVAWAIIFCHEITTILTGLPSTGDRG